MMPIGRSLCGDMAIKKIQSGYDEDQVNVYKKWLKEWDLDDKTQKTKQMLMYHNTNKKGKAVLSKIVFKQHYNKYLKPQS